VAAKIFPHCLEKLDNMQFVDKKQDLSIKSFPSEPLGDSVLAQLPCHLSSGEVLDTESVTHVTYLNDK